MNKIGLLASSLFVAATLAVAPAASAAYYFLVTADGIDGESIAKGEEKAIQASAFSLSMRVPVSASGQASGKRQYSAATFTKKFGKASPQLWQNAALSKALKSVKIEFSQTAAGVSSVYDTVTLTNVTVTGITRRASSGGELEDVSLSFQKIEIADDTSIFSDNIATATVQ